MAGLPRRIIKETQRLMQEPVPGISAVPDDGNARYFHVVVAGPEGSPFEGGVFKLELFLPEDYPMSAPKVGLHFYTHTSEYHLQLLNLKHVTTKTVFYQKSFIYLTNYSEMKSP